ncbi:MAG: PadR family transcriptional regulator [Oscillospiraceae bacterium]
MSLRHEILGILSYRNLTGYELTKFINSDGLFFWNAQQSQVYREISKLEKEANSESTESKKVFEVTDAGMEELKNWIETNDIQASLEIKNPLVMKMFFANRGDLDGLIIQVEKYKSECKRMLAEIAISKNDILEMAENKMDSVFFTLNSYYGVGFYNFSIEWADKCLKILNKLKGE